MSLWVTIAAISLTALIAMGRIFLVSVIGYVSALYPKENPLLPPSTVKILSRLSNVLFLPCLIVYSLGSGLSLTLFNEMSILIPFCFLNEAIAYTIAFTIGRIIQEDDEELYTAVSVAIGSPNVISFPLMIMETLCKQSEQVRGDFADDKTCFVESTSMLFVYSIAWHFVFWGFGYPRLQTLLEPKNNEVVLFNQTDFNSDHIEMVSLNADTESGESTTIKVLSSDKKTMFLRFTRLRGEMWRVLSIVLTSPPIISTCIGITLGIIGPLRNALFKDFTFLTPFGSALATVAQPIICLNCMIMSSSLATVKIFPVKSVASNDLSVGKSVSKQKTTNTSSKKSQEQDAQESLARFSVGQYAADGISFDTFQITGTRKRSVSESDVNAVRLSYNRTRTSDPERMPNVLPKISEDNLKVSTPKDSNIVSPPQSRTIFAMIFCRLILAPAVMLPLCHYCVKSGWMSGKSRTSMLVVVLESAAPSAQMMIVALSQLGLAKTASQIAYLYVFQYLSAILTITFWTTLTISLLY